MKKQAHQSNGLELQACSDARSKHREEAWKAPLHWLKKEKLREELRTFLDTRVQEVSFTTWKKEKSPCRQVCRFLEEKESELKSFHEKTYEELKQSLTAWLLANGYVVYKKHYRKDRGKYTYQDADAICYLKKIYRFLGKKEESEVSDPWDLRSLDIPPEQNPINPHYRLDFVGIKQDAMRQEVKDVLAFHARYKAAETLRLELWAVTAFSRFLQKSFPEVESFKQIQRVQLEDYLIYVRTESKLKSSSYASQFVHLKNVFIDLGQMKEWPHLTNLFLKTDFKTRITIKMKIYSEEELKRLNQGIVTLEPQVARALFLHQILGLRISDTLTLRTDCLLEKCAGFVIRIHQPKTTSYEKPITEEVMQLVQAAISNTFQNHGETDYIFVQDRHPEKPMSYGKVEYQLKAMIREKQILDDQGTLLQFGTHIFRHNYGKKLAELGLDDYTIMQLLGHSTLRSIRHYRMLGSKQLAEETREMRNKLDRRIRPYLQEWGYEEV
ncbi:tyrosine-type recombinase/integrase [Zhenpiania hominis]|uniref:Tyrosine-type recombinase/integrase n=1 Tax=Zhenpiania hominis TaxID=2763644 RepID=A0A923NLX8_9FIRM|nr:tyrosine-type recombinase/integrase [Zhenpiania hominis]MBC6679592.1 tyrosine-type recombinase/integrase [Zhenpiania hominis]